MASAAVTANTNLLYVLESDTTEREFTNAPPDDNARYWLVTIQNVGAGAAAVSLASGITGDPDAPTQQANEAVIPAGGSLPLPRGTLTFYHKATTATTLNVVLDKN